MSRALEYAKGRNLLCQNIDFFSGWRSVLGIADFVGLVIHLHYTDCTDAFFELLFLSFHAVVV